MSASRFTVACCMLGSGSGKSVGITTVVVVRRQAPRPLDRAGAEDQGAAAGPVQGQAVSRRAVAASESKVLP